MRRSLLTAVGIMALTLAAPSAALAHHGHGRHHHKARAKAHHAKFRVVHIGASTASTSGSSPGASTGTTSPTAPTTPENAGTVTSYTNNVLTLTLNDGTTVSGKVTSATEIRCIKAAPTTPPAGTEGEETEGQGDDQGQGDTNQEGDHESSGPDESQGDHQDDGDDEGIDQGSPEPPCDSSSLVAGAVVRAAELRIGPTGSEFESVWLVR